MGAELSRRIDLAGIDARCRHHDAAEPEHLLGVVIELQQVADALREQGLDPLELRDRLDARFTAMPSIGGYRDGSAAPLSEALARVAKRLDGPWRPFTPKTSVLDALLLEPSIAALVFELRRGNDYRHILARAFALAVMSGHACTTIGHVFRVLLDLRSFADAVHRAAGDTELLRATVDEALSAAQPMLATTGAPAPEPAVQAVVARAKAMARRSATTAATVRQFCLELARHDDSARFWSAAGIEASAFVRAVHLPDQEAMRARDLLR